MTGILRTKASDHATIPPSPPYPNSFLLVPIHIQEHPPHKTKRASSPPAETSKSLPRLLIAPRPQHFYPSISPQHQGPQGPPKCHHVFFPFPSPTFLSGLRRMSRGETRNNTGAFDKRDRGSAMLTSGHHAWQSFISVAHV